MKYKSELTIEQISNELDWSKPGTINAIYIKLFSSFSFYKGVFEASKITKDINYSINNSFLGDFIDKWFLMHSVVIINRLVDKQQRKSVLSLRTIIDSLEIDSFPNKQKMINLLCNSCFGRIKKFRDEFIAHYSTNRDENNKVLLDDIEIALVNIGKIIYELNKELRGKDDDLKLLTHTSQFENLTYPFVNKEQAALIAKIYEQTQHKMSSKIKKL